MIDPHLLFSYDPGGTTGFACFHIYRSRQIAVLELYGELSTWMDIDTHILHPDVQTVVYENIVPRSPEFNPIGIETIGVIKYLCRQRGIPAISQPNSLIHGISRWGTYDSLWGRVHSQHSRDALAHGIVYLRKLGYQVETG